MTIPCDFRGRDGRSGWRWVLRIAYYVGRWSQNPNLPPVGRNSQPSGRQMLLWVFHYPLIGLVDIGPPPSNIGINSPIHDIPKGCGLESHNIRVC